jgi:hemerythrin-like domain-containing protein
MSKNANLPGVHAMNTICAYLMLDHKRCDDLFARAETSIAQRNWDDANENFRLFHDALRQHIRMEEKVLLPAFIRSIPDSAMPVSMLHIEHEQIRGIADRMFESLHRFDPIDFVLHAETYTLLMQQHTVKEEDMLYPLLDRVLERKRDKIISAMAEYLDPDFHAVI